MKKQGFSLIELLIALVIVGLLSAIAYPAYTSYVVKARRADGKTSLLNMANLMERYYSQNNTYVGATLANLGIANPTPEGYYNLQVSATTATSYSVQATAIGAQATQDSTCGNYTLNELGQHGISGGGSVADCW